MARADRLGATPMREGSSLSVCLAGPRGGWTMDVLHDAKDQEDASRSIAGKPADEEEPSEPERSQESRHGRRGGEVAPGGQALTITPWLRWSPRAQVERQFAAVGHDAGDLDQVLHGVCAPAAGCRDRRRPGARWL